MSEPKRDEPEAWTGPYSEGYTRYVLFIVLLVMIFNNADRTVLSILISPIKAEFELTDFQMGLLMGPAFTIVYTGLALPVARWADFGVRRSIVAGGLFVWSLFTVGTYFVTSFFQLFAMRMGVGVGEAAGTAPNLSMLSDYVPRNRRARSLSVISIGAVTGLGFGMIAGGVLNEIYGWRVAFLAVGLPGILLAGVMRLTVKEPPRGATEAADVDTKAVSWANSVRYLGSLKTFWFILAANAFSLFAAMGRNLWEPEFLVRTYEMGTGSAGIWYYVTSPLPSAVGIFLGGYLADRLGGRDPRWFLGVPALGQLISVPILIGFLLWPEDDHIAMPAFVAALGLASVPIAFVLSFVGSIFGAFFTAPFLATLQGISKIRMRATVAALSTTVSSFVGHTLGPMAVGGISDYFNAGGYGSDALRYSLLVPTAAPILSAAVCLVGARFVGRDLLRAREG